VVQDIEIWSIQHEVRLLLLFMWMGRDYVFELGPPAGLLFTPKAIYESGDPWWNEVDRGKLLTRPSELSGNFTRRDIW